MIQSAIRGRQREIVNLRTDITKLLNTESISIQVSLFLFFLLFPIQLTRNIKIYVFHNYSYITNLISGNISYTMLLEVLMSF